MSRMLLLPLLLSACELVLPLPEGSTPPGTYVTTVPDAPTRIERTPTSVTAFVGVPAQLPSEPVVRVSSMLEYEALLGGRAPAGSPLALATSVALFFANGGGEAVIVPVGTHADGPPTASDLRAGLATLEAADASPALVLVPDAAATLSPADLLAFQGDQLATCAELGALCLLDLPRPDDLLDTVSAFRAGLPLGDVAYGAAYVPWLSVTGPDGKPRELPPSGVVAGVIARTDHERGIWVSPANTSVSGVLGLTHAVDDVIQEDLQLDPGRGLSVNPIRSFTAQGILVWGARTLAGNDNEWRYVSVRRTALWLEHSLQAGTEWVVFEPNDEPLWVRVRGLVENHLQELFREGAFQGATPGDAYFVRVGLGETMTAQDVLEGRLIIEVGFAPLRPAEFVILRIEHRMADGG